MKPTSQHLFIVYEISTNDTIELGNKAVSIERFTKEELRKALREHPERFGAAYYFVLEHFYPGYLPEGYQKQWAK